MVLGLGMAQGVDLECLGERAVAHRVGDDVDALAVRAGDEIVEERRQVPRADLHRGGIGEVGPRAPGRRPGIEDRHTGEVEIVDHLRGALGGAREGDVESVDEDEDLVETVLVERPADLFEERGL